MKLVRVLLLTALALVLAACQTAGPVRPVADQPLEDVVYSDDDLLDLIRHYARDDGEGVDYAAWKDQAADLERLDRHVATIAAVSPESHPEQFVTPAERKSYWINSYNALVLQAVLEYWPLESVQDVKISLTSRVIPGKGFFYDRPVVVGGRETNLYDLEKEVLKSQKDPRLHFALNCASESCPVIRPWEWTDEQLDQATREFVNKVENVAVEDETLYLSAIFKWYRKDFPDDIHGYLRKYADTELAEQIALAEERDFPVRYRKYDWSLNEAGDEHNGG